MMITIHGLPPQTTFQAVKALVKQECNIIDFILDNLVADGPNSKKVRIGVSDDAEGYRILKCLNGFRMSPSHLLKIVPVGKNLKPPSPQIYDQRGFQDHPRNDYSDQTRSVYQRPIDDYREPHDTRKGNYVPPHMRTKKLNSGQPDRNTGPLNTPNSGDTGLLRPSELRPHNLNQIRHEPHRSHGPEPVLQGTHEPMQAPHWSQDGKVNVNNQWGTPQGNQVKTTFNQGGFGPQHLQSGQDTYGPGRGSAPHSGQGFGFQPKSNILDGVAPARDTRQHVLRTVDIVDTAPPARQYPPEKPITIMKDNFQGPSQYSGTPQHGTYSAQGQASMPVWQMSHKKSQSYDDRNAPMDKRPDAPMQDYEKRGQFVPIGGRPLSPSRRTSPPRGGPPGARNYQEPIRRMSPTMQGRGFPERRVSPSRLGPPVRAFSPSGRRISPGRRMSPGRKISPGRMSPGRKMSPGRRFSPRRKISPGRRFSPGRKMSPGRRLSPGRMSPRRRISPGRRMSPGRVSPGRRDVARRISPNDKRMGRCDSPRRFSPDRYSPTRRLVSPNRSRFSPSRDKPSDKFMDGGKGSKLVRPAYEPTQAPNQSYTGGYRDSVQYSMGGRPSEHSSWQNEKTIYPPNKEEDRRDMMRRDKTIEKPPGRLSRSPRRDRSPLKDRYRRSPSPRSSRSPRRSWALEKRSPEIRQPPPPPLWPGQEPEPTSRKPTRFDPVDTKNKAWDQIDEPRPFEHKLRVRTDLEEKFSDKFSPRREFERDYQDFKPINRSPQTHRNYHRTDDRPDYRRESSPRRDDKKDRSVFSAIDKGIQDIYKRAVEFRKKTEERQKSGERRREDYEKPRQEDRYRQESPRRSRSPIKKEWNTKERKRMLLPIAVKVKRDKAVSDIVDKMIANYDLERDQKMRIMEELKVTLYSKFLEMFGDKDLSFIELVIKYQAKYPPNEEEKLLREVLSTMPSQYRNLKRKAAGDASEIAMKKQRRSPTPKTKEANDRPRLSDSVIPDWDIPGSKLEPPKVLSMPLTAMSVAQTVNLANPGMVPAPVYLSAHVEMSKVFQQQQQMQYGHSSMQQYFSDNTMQKFNDAQEQSREQRHEPGDVSSNDGYYNLYLCQDDFEPFSSIQAKYLKNFLFNQIVSVTEMSNGWAPDITLKGLQSALRYEVCTKDERSKDWLVNLNFAEFEYFNVLVYTKEELWYERAAIWLPGHSRSRALEPFEKLKRQNRDLEGVNISKWKFVKKVVTLKGTRLYVDMPPSSARALEKHKMTLSYEIQKVNVFLKAVAVDKDVFDAGLKENSITDPSLLTSALQNSPMPTLSANEPSIVKIGLSGRKSLNVEQARKIKEVVVYHLVKHLQNDGSGKTDFLKFGFLPPTFLGIVPENSESKKWLLSRSFGKMARSPIVVFGDDNDNTKYFKMFASIPQEYHLSMTLVFERLKQSNQGIKGMHFNLWKPQKLTSERRKVILEVDVDLESVETLSKMKYKLDYITAHGIIEVVTFQSEYSLSKLEEKIRKCKMELIDSYDVANMEIDSDDSDKDVVFVK